MPHASVGAPVNMHYANAKNAIWAAITYFLRACQKVHTDKWQGVDIKTKPDMAMFEVNGVSFKFDMGAYNNRNLMIEHIKPNIPWAEDHFQERVHGLPLNPGNEWKNWPWGHSANNFRKYGVNQDQFSHTYMERFWPKLAGKTSGPQVNKTNRGVRFNYGDLNDIVTHLVADPYSRQAYLPIWFPEDTGAVFKGRVPCTLGYHFIQRDGELSITYYIRSVDIYRHFRDDIYMAVRLAQWMLNELQRDDKGWNRVKLGTYTMHIANLHCFVNDKRKLENEQNNA